MSNAEKMVMVPRDWAQSMVDAGRGEPVDSSDVDILRAALEAQQGQRNPIPLPEGYMLAERSIWTEQQVEAATACITRLKGVPGMRDRDLAMAAIDAAQCKAPEVTLADLLPAQQGQGEPIMLAAVGKLQEDGDGGLEVQWLLEGGTSELFHGMTLLVAENAPELCSEDGSAQVYTHADPAEVERLRAEVTYWKSAHDGSIEWCNQIIGEREEQREKADALRAQLSELRESMEFRTSLIGRHETHLVEAHALLEEAYQHDIGTPLKRKMRALHDALSASAEPSAPVEIDERAEFDAWFCVERGLAPDTDTTFINDAYQPWRGWQARAALARKSVEPLPPVDGDLLPPIGSKVLIHLGREDKWAEHTVVGYYAWGSHGLDQNVHRVFVRVRDAEGYLNARLLSDVRPVDAAPPQL